MSSPVVLFSADEQQAMEACAAWLRTGSKSFYLASCLLPARLRGPAAAIYAFCREADDLIDAPQADAVVEDPVAQLRARLQRIYAGSPLYGPVDRGMAAVVRAYALPQGLFFALLEGFAWDRAGRTYDSLTDLEAYAARVAGSVGVLITLLMGERRPAVLARAADLGVAMQLTNIARDVGEDALNKRLYLPHRWLVQAGLSPEEFLQAPQPSPQLAQVVQRLLAHADGLYRQADAGIAFLPRDCRWGIAAARSIYRQIGVRLQQRGPALLLQRTVVSRPRKLWLVLRSCLASRRRPRATPWPVLSPAAFLLHAAGASVPP